MEFLRRVKGPLVFAQRSVSWVQGDMMESVGSVYVEWQYICICCHKAGNANYLFLE